MSLERLRAPAERNVAPREANVSLLRSFKALLNPGSINIGPSGTEDYPPHKSLDPLVARTLLAPALAPRLQCLGFGEQRLSSLGKLCLLRGELCKFFSVSLTLSY